MRPSMGARKSMETDQPMAPKKKVSTIPYIAGIITLGLCGLAVLLGYRGYTTNMEKQINSVSETCADSDSGAELFKDPPSTTVKYWAFNISNPYEYANGASAELMELGPYGVKLHQKRSHVDFSESAGTVTYDMYNDVEFKASASCDDCSEDDTINVANFAYLKVLGGVQNEGMLLIAASCSQSQIANIQDTSGTKSYCEPSEMNTPVDCICCAPTATENATTCGDLATASSRAGGVHSWLAKYDNGLQLDSNPSAFILSTGSYTPLIRQVTVTELVFGTVSAQLGMLTTAQAVGGGDVATVYANSNTTNDLRDACYVNNCPQLGAVLNDVSTQGVNAIKNVECTGRVPSYKVLMSEGGLSEERAKELRYLEGVSCRPFSVSIAIAAVLKLDAGAIAMCGDGSALNDTPCCLKSFVSTAFNIQGSGIGCHTFVNGLIQSRRVYSDEEARKYITPSPETQAHTGCAHGSDKFKQIMTRGVTSYKDWFTPASYTYPNMPWADPTVVSSALKGVAPGTMTIFNVTGYLPAIREGRGITSKFLDYQLTNGDPKYDEELLWSNYQLNTLLVEYDETHVRNGIEVNRFLPEIDKAETDVEIEAEQRQGQLPYGNMENLVYASDGGPIIMSFPLFYSSDVAILSQTDNTQRASPLTTGVNLYRTRDGYKKKSKLLESPELVTTETWDEFGTSDYRGYLNIEPATGLSLSGAVVNMLSTFTWNCNPQMDPTCSFKATAYDPSNPMCYINPTAGIQMPCGATNVFTPKVMGSKVMPLYWIHSKPQAPSYVSRVLDSSIRTRYALSILVIIVPVLALIGIVILSTMLIKISRHNNETTDGDRTISRISMGTKPADIVFAPEGLHKGVSAENDIM